MGVHGKSNRIGKAAAVRPTRSDATIDLPEDLQQRCLNIFKDALWTSSDDLAMLQEVKQHLYNREFVQAFSRPDYLRAYALRWSASRALGYAAIFKTVSEHFEVSTGATLRVLCIGGGAGAEVVGLAGLVALQATDEALSQQDGGIAVHAIDIADWSDVLLQLEHAITNPPRLSQYASAAAKEKNRAMLTTGKFASTFSQADVLGLDQTVLSTALADVQLVTIMFTLNELYTTSVPLTQRFLGLLTASMQHNAVLLIVDSPGTYSTVSIKGAEKKYPMQWLVDLTLLGSGKQTTDDSDNESKWIKKLQSTESQWFRLPGTLQYPVELEDMRCQIHLYKRQRRS